VNESLSPVDLLVSRATLVATCSAEPDNERPGSERPDSELAGGWVAITDGVIVAVGGPGSEPPATRVIDASGCLVTPGLINTHHHLYQNLTRAFRPATGKNLFGWLTTLYPIWAGLDEDAAFLSAWIGLAELALGGCTTSMDHLYVHPAGGGDLISAEIAAAREVGLRFHATRGSMSRSQKDGGLPPDSVVQDDDEILADSERLVGRHHERGADAMVQVALAPCSPFTVTPGLMRKTAALAEQLDVRLHTHLAEDADEDSYCLDVYGCRPVEYFEDVGWGSDRSWVAHCVFPDATEIARLARWGTGVAHCPGSNQMIGAGLAPISEMRAAGVPVGIGCDGSASTDAASLWMEARNALMLGRLRGGPEAMQARDALDMATNGSARCLGRFGEIGVLKPGAAGDVVVWPMEGVRFAGALSDPIEAWLRCGPVSAKHTIVAGRLVVEDGRLTHPAVDDMLARHRVVAARLQNMASG
jgi:cytosine/adenosine deaminase-related metal-dependent hydrolase